MIYRDGKPVELRSICECCRAEMIQSTVWAQKGRGREAVPAGSVTILKAVDKTIEMWAGDHFVGTVPGAERQPTLASTAAQLKGKWVLLRRETMVRLEAISYWRPEPDGGAHVLVDGVAIQASRRCWPLVKRQLA